MLGKHVTKLIIVCDEKTKNYANYLRQLISVNDDKDGEIIGIEDGTVEVAVWLDKEYLANAATLSSNEHILFIGQNKTSKSETSSMNIKFDLHGMKYGWLGKRAMMQVDDAMLNETQYNNFFNYCCEYEQQFEKIVYKQPKKLVKTQKNNEEKVLEVAEVEIVEEKGKDKKKIASVVGVAGAIVAAQILSPIGATGALIGINTLSSHKKIKDQQYRALTVIFYLDGLREFLEE